MNTTDRTARTIVAGTWGCAAIVMGGSATNAYLAYGAIGDNRGLGLATGLAVDIGLCVALIGDRQLYLHGLSSNWGRALRITTAGMSLVLNTAVALRDSHILMAVLHAFLPVLLVVLTEYGQDVLLKFAALKSEAERQTESVRAPESVPKWNVVLPAVPTAPAVAPVAAVEAVTAPESPRVVTPEPAVTPPAVTAPVPVAPARCNPKPLTVSSKADAVRAAFTAIGTDDIPGVIAWLTDRGVTVDRTYIYDIRRRWTPPKPLRSVGGRK